MSDAKPDRKNPTPSNIADAVHTSDQRKNRVNESSGATFESISVLNPESKPVEIAQPITAAIKPSSKNGN